MQIGRQSFYNTFQSKADFYDEAIREYTDRYQRPMIELLSSGDSPDANVMKLLIKWENAAGQQPNDGCFLVNACGDVPCLREESASLATALARQMEDAITEQIEAALKAEEITSQLSARKIAHILNMLGNGLMGHARNSKSKSSCKGLMTHTYRQLALTTG